MIGGDQVLMRTGQYQLKSFNSANGALIRRDQGQMRLERPSGCCMSVKNIPLETCFLCFQHESKCSWEEDHSCSEVHTVSCSFCVFFKVGFIFDAQCY